MGSSTDSTRLRDQLAISTMNGLALVSTSLTRPVAIRFMVASASGRLTLSPCAFASAAVMKIEGQGIDQSI
ncbi:hypothetical protein D3C86_1567390 [compost metagenome]